MPLWLVARETRPFRESPRYLDTLADLDLRHLEVLPADRGPVEEDLDAVFPPLPAGRLHDVELGDRLAGRSHRSHRFVHHLTRGLGPARLEGRLVRAADQHDRRVDG